MNDAKADVYLHNGVMITMDPALPEATAMAIKNGRIVWIGDQSQTSSLWVGDNTQLIDLQGCYVYPGFIDTHMHVLYTGITKNYLQLKNCESKQAILEKVKEYALNFKEGEWIIGIGWDNQHWGKEKYNALDLDKIVPNNPVMLVRTDTHLVWVNSLALKLAGIDAHTVNPEGGYIEKDAVGNPNGKLLDRAIYLIRNILPRNLPEDNVRIIQNVLQEFSQKGITTVHNAATDEIDFEAFKQLAFENTLNMRIFMMAALRDKSGNDLTHQGPQKYNDFLELRYIKLWMDGALGSKGALLFEPYNDDLNNCGLLLWESEDLHVILEDAKAKGFQVAIHAIGDKASHTVLDAYEKVGVQGLRWRIEHAQQLAEDDIGRFSELGVIASMQPLHLITDMNWLEERLGKERTESGSFVWRSLLNNDTVITGGSDAPVVDANPLWGIYAAITRQDFNQLPQEGWYPDQKMTRYEALKMYTMDAAYSSFSENELGSLTIGKFADLVVLPENLLTCPSTALLDMNVLYTFLNGKIVYSSKNI